MANRASFQGELKSMAALGRGFQLGDLYDYHHDRIIHAGIVEKYHCNCIF